MHAFMMITTAIIKMMMIIESEVKLIIEIICLSAAYKVYI